jgi:peroxiredoxin
MKEGCCAAAEPRRLTPRTSDNVAGAGIKVAALSVDDEPATAELIAKHGLTFPVGHSADARAIAGLAGPLQCAASASV